MAKNETIIPISIQVRQASRGLMAGIIVLIADRKTILFDRRITGFAEVFGLPDSHIQIPVNHQPIVRMSRPVVDMMAVSMKTMKIPRIDVGD